MNGSGAGRGPRERKTGDDDPVEGRRGILRTPVDYGGKLDFWKIDGGGDARRGVLAKLAELVERGTVGRAHVEDDRVHHRRPDPGPNVQGEAPGAQGTEEGMAARHARRLIGGPGLGKLGVPTGSGEGSFNKGTPRSPWTKLRRRRFAPPVGYHQLRGQGHAKGDPSALSGPQPDEDLGGRDDLPGVALGVFRGVEQEPADVGGELGLPDLPGGVQL